MTKQAVVDKVPICKLYAVDVIWTRLTQIAYMHKDAWRSVTSSDFIYQSDELVQGPLKGVLVYTLNHTGTQKRVITGGFRLKLH